MALDLVADRNVVAGPFPGGGYAIDARNISGSTLPEGAVVVLSTTGTNADIRHSFTTTTAQDDAAVMGVLINGPVLNGSIGRVMTEGFADKLLVDGTTDIAAGDVLGTFTSAGIAAKASTISGCFAIALEAYTADDSNGTIKAIVTRRAPFYALGDGLAALAFADNQDLGLGTGNRTTLSVDTFSGSGYSGGSAQNPAFDTNIAHVGRLLIAPGNTNGELPTPAYGEPLMIGIRGKTFTDNDSTGTVTSPVVLMQIDQSTLAASSAVTYDDAIMLNVNMPAAGTNMTFTRKWAIWSDGPINIDDSTDISASDPNTASLHTGGGVNIAKSVIIASGGSGILHINDTANANMTTGINLNQNTATNEAISLKASGSIAHGLTGQTETDTWFKVIRTDGGLGGTIIDSFAEDGAISNVLGLRAWGGTADTAKTTASRGLIELFAAEHDGSNGIANITADGNVLVVRARVGGASVSRFQVDEDGDLHAVNATVGAYDNEDDVAMIRAFELNRTGEGIVRDEWDGFVKYNESDLIRIGVLGAPVAEGGMWNITQHMRLMNGAIVQLRNDLLNIASALPEDVQQSIKGRVGDTMRQIQGL